MTILELVRPIIIRTYGSSEMSRALAERLAGRIAAWDTASDPPPRRVMVAEIVWDWMAGAELASVVAEQIDTALVKAGH